jgi:hypothetical protein
MRLIIVSSLILVFALFFSGCQTITPKSPVRSLPEETLGSPSPSPTATITPSPTAKLKTGSEIISTEKLNCTQLGTFAKCVDQTLKIEFEHPISWGAIEGVLRTGWDNGYAYKYYFNGATIPETYMPEAEGLSIDFVEGREQVPLDFAGFESTYIDSCEWQDLYPICEYVNPKVRWMIRFPNAKYFCENTHQFTSPIFRIEVNLPDNPTINGLVFEIPFLSEALLKEVQNTIYPLLLSEIRNDPSSEPFFVPSFETCRRENRQPFDNQVYRFIDRMQTKSLDNDTVKKLDELIYLANSISFR